MNLKAFAGFAAWGLVAASISLIFVFAATIFFGSAENVVIDGINVSTSAPNGATSGGSAGIVVKNDTTVLYNFTLNITSGNNISVINITFPSWPFDSASANISLVNTSSAPATVQLGGPVLTGWTVRFIENFTNGGIKTVQLNGSLAATTINGSNITWFAFNATTNITGAGNLSDNHTMTWNIYTANITHSALVKTTTLVDNNPPRIFNVVPELNSSGPGRAYIRGLAAELFQVNVSEANLNISSSTVLLNGSTNVTMWYKKSGAVVLQRTTLLCYNATGGYLPNGPTETSYTCNTTVDLSSAGSLNVQENNIIQFFFNSSDLVLNVGYNGTQDSPREAQVDRTSASSTAGNTLSNASFFNTSNSLRLNARFTDNFALRNATLTTNETNEASFTNYTANNTYGSPIRMAGSTYVVNFTWRNGSVANGQIIGWQILATDEAGNVHTTALQTFTVDTAGPATGFIAPTHKSNVSGVVTVNVSVNDSLAGVSLVYLNVSYEAPTGSISAINNITLTQGPTGFFSGTINSTFNLAGVVRDGNFTLRIVANDTLNNINNTQNITVWFDNVLPSISVISPAANTHIRGRFDISAEVTDSVRVTNVTYRISNATFSSGVTFQLVNSSDILVNNSGVYNVTNLTSAAVFGDGVYNVTIIANDSVGNLTFANVSITIDNNAPTFGVLNSSTGANITDPIANSGFQYVPGRVYTFNLTVSDDINVTYVVARINATNYTATRYALAGVASNWSVQVTDMAGNNQGHVVVWYVNDTAGNLLTSAAWNYAINRNTSGFANVTVNQTNVERGTAFNISSKGMVNDGLVSELNASLFGNTTGTFALGGLIALRLSNGANTNITLTASLPVGRYNITANITETENYTNNATLHSITLTIQDTLAPISAVLDQSSYTNGTIRRGTSSQSCCNITLNITVADNTNGAGFPNPFNISIFLVNSSGTAIFAANISNSTGAYVGTSTQVNATFPIPANTADNVIDDGNRTLRFVVADSQGNVLTNGSTNYTVSIDNTGANYSNPKPANNSFNLGGGAELFQISMTEVNINISKNVTLYWGFGPAIPSAFYAKTLLCSGSLLYNDVGPNFVCNATIALSGLGDGDIVYYFFNNSNVTQPSGDIAGNGAGFGTAVAPLNTTVDRAVPVVGFLLPLNASNISGSFTLNISANNTPAGISNVSYRITNDTFTSEMILLTRGAGTAFAGYWNGTNNTAIAGLGDGVYRVNINVTDFAGNVNRTVNITITIDNTRPNVTVVRPTTLLNFSSSIAINATVRDSGLTGVVPTGDIRSVQYYLSNSSWTGQLLTMANNTPGPLFDMYNATNFTSANLADGRYNITINATDYAGNSNTTQSAQINIDNNAPIINIKNPAANAFIRGPVNITAEVNDGVWVWYVQYRIGNGTYAADIIDASYLRMTNGTGNSGNATNGGYYNATNTTAAGIFSDGVYNITVIANDTVNNITQVNVSVTIDNNAPSSGGLQSNTSEPAGGTGYFPGRLYKFNKTFNDTIGVTSVILQINATNFTAFRYEGSATLGNWSANITDIAANASGYPLIWYANDSAGNWLTTAVWYYAVAKNTSAFTTISINQTTVERGDYVNITVRSTTRNEINTTLYTNYTGALARITTFVPYPANNQNITFTGYLRGIWNISANTTETENYTANASLESLTFLVQDTARPGLRIYDYTNGTRVKPGDIIRLNVSISDNYGIDSAFNVSVYFNGSTIGSWVFAGNISNSTFSSNATSAWANGTVTIPSTGMNVAGNRTINITILDSASNLGMNDSFVINMDPGAPIWRTNGTTPGSDIEYFPGRTYIFNITLTDEPLGVDYVALEFNGTNYTATRFGGTIYSGNWSVSLTDLAANSSVTGYRFRWYMNDTFGQWNTSDYWNYTIYKNSSVFTRIVINQTTVERGDFVNITVYSASVRNEINVTLYTNYSGSLARITTFVPYSSWNENTTFTGYLRGIWNISANTTETANYSTNATLESRTFLVQDTQRPGLRIYDYTNGTRVKLGDTIRLNISISDNYGIDSAFNVSVYFNGSTIGSWIFAGNISNSTFSSNATSAWANGTVTIPTSSMTTDGNRTINITILDSSSNLGMNDSFVVNVDTGAPIWTNNATSPGSDIQYFPGRIYRFNLTVTDEPLGVDYVSLEFNGTNYTASRIAGTIYSGNWTVNITDLAANSSVTGYRFRWYMNDTFGQWNTSDYLNYTIYTNTSATARLEVNVTVAERGTYINITSYSPISALINTTIYANFSAFALGAINYIPYTSGNQNITSVGTNLVVGPYNITANTTRNENYSANASVYMITITVQDSSPVSSLVAPVNNSNHTATLSINASVTDQGGVDTVRFNISNNTWIGTTGYLNSTGNVGNHYNATVNIATISDGNYNLTILPNDTFGNLNSSYYFKVSIDSTAPVITFSYQLEGTRLTGYTPGNNSYRSGIASINVTITDEFANFTNNSVFVRIGNATHWTGPQFRMANLTSLTVQAIFNYSNVTSSPSLRDGSYNISVTVNDTLGNSRTNATFFNIDNTAPSAVIALSNSTRGTYRPNTTEQIRIQINDALQTNATIDIYTRWPNGTTNLYNASWATPGTNAVYAWTIDTSDLVTDQMVKYYVVASDNASNAATGTGTLASPLSNITVDVNCGNVGTPLSWCSGSALKTTANGWATVNMPTKGIIEQFSSLQGNFTVDNVTKRVGIWQQFNYTYLHDGSSWLSFDPLAAPTSNTLKTFNNSATEYWFNINASNVVFRIA